VAVIDDKVVALSFESSKFESGVNKAISALDKLKASLKIQDVGKGFEKLQGIFKSLSLGHLGQSVDEVSNKLRTFHLVAIGVLSQLATQAVRAAGRFAKAFTIDPIKAGFSEYTTNLNAVQTILANTQASGAKLKDVNAALKQLNDYSDKTIYNFSQMAKNIGTFTAAGVDLDTATGSIKGIANLAALSGSNAEQASTAMYQLSQAIAAGRVNLQDWNSVVNAGMGGTVFQRALAQTAVAMGTLDEKTVKLTGKMKNVSIAGESFRNSISAKPGEKSWLTSDVLTKTLQQFTGDLSAAELKAQGFNDAQIKAIQQTATTAMKAATEVKTLQGVLDTAKETAGSGWAQTWQIIFGDFGEAKTLFTGLSNAVNGFIKANADARNKVLQDWKDLGGRTILIDSVRTAFHNLGMIVAPIKDAFRDIFPPVTGKTLLDLTKRFQDFAEALKPSPTTIENLRRTFRGLFAILDIGKQVISGIFHFFSRLFNAAGGGEGKFLNLTARIGDFIVALDESLKKGNKITKFFDGLAGVLGAPLKLLGALADAVSNLFEGFSSAGISDEIDGVTSSLSPFSKILQAVANAWNRFIEGFAGSGDVFQSIGESVAKGLGTFVTAFGNAMSTMNFEAILAVIRTGLLVGLTVMFKKFLGKGSAIDQITKGFGGGILANISGTFKALEGSMVALQNNIKAKTLKEIAIAIALLTASVVALSFVDPERLKSSLTAMTVAFGQLLGAMAILGNITKTMGFVKMPVIAGAMILLAGAITTLSIAVVILSRLSWEELAKGLGGVAALLVAVSAASIPLSANSAGMVRAGVGLTAMAIALNLLALAVKQMASMNMKELGKGLGAIAVGLVLLIDAMRNMPVKGIISAGIGVIALAAGLRILASAVAAFGGMDLRTIGQGLLGIAASLGIIVVAMKFLPKDTALKAAGLLIVAGALNLIAIALAKMGGMSIREIGKSLIALGGALFLLIDAMYAMEGALPGALALTVVAGGIALLAPALVMLGKMSWATIVKGLVALAAAFAVIGVAGALITGAVPGLLGFGAALVLVGAGVALVGAGLFLISAALSALVVAAPTGVGILVAAFTELVKGLISNIKLLVLGLLEIVKALAATAPQFVDAIVKILSSVVDAIIQMTPKIVQLFEALIDAALQVLHDKQGEIIQAGFDLLIALLQGIRNNIPQLVTLVVDIVVKFIQAISANLNRIVNAGIQLFASLIKGIISRISTIATTVLNIITAFLSAVASNLGKIATAGLSVLTKFLSAISGAIGKVIKTATDVIVAFVEGIGNAGARIVKAGTDAIIKFINALSSNSVRLANAGIEAVINFLNGIANAINSHIGEMRQAGLNIGYAIINGMTGGLVGKAGELYNKISGIMGKAMGLMHKVAGVFSPSRITNDIGENLILGMVKGLDNTAPKAYDSAEAMSNGVIKSFTDTFQITSPSKVMMEIGQYVGQGFAEGLRGSGDDIRGVFTDLNNKLTEAMQKARETIASEEDKLAKLRKAKKQDASAIKEAQETIKENQDLLARSTAGHIALTKTLQDEKKTLIGLTGDYEKIGERLKGAKDALKQATQTRDEAIKGFADQYSTLPDIVKEDAEGNSIDQLATYMQALDNQAKAVAAYQSTLDQLRKLGLDDKTYQKLLSEGPQDQAFATQLLSGGKTAVAGLNRLDTQLANVSKTLATNAGRNLYQAGVDAAQGLVNGLSAKRSAIRREMEEIAREMLSALKKELKIKSPSQAFAEIGKFAMEGMAQGFSNSSKIVTDAVDDAAKDALSQMQESMRGISDAVTNELNPNPVITPILDLTQVRAGAAELGALTSVTPITAAASYGQASIISSEQLSAQEELTAVAPGGTHVKFEQNNYSPEALTEIEIYRQTKNQLSQLKSVLEV